jgi:para-nitrobenzyl esterase
VRDGSRFGNRCVQTNPFDDMIWNSEAESEDCLYLSVWAKQDAKSLPVMVWIHGGGFASGSGGEARHDGARLAERGAVVVTINYRLGLLGFLAHPDLTAETGRSGNYGLMDMVAALQWIGQNIEAFGGDPGNVTIFGESAGSFAVSALMASPLASGLFHRAIGQSGAMFETAREPFTRLEAAESSGLKFAKAAGAETIAALRKMPAKGLVRLAVGQEMNFWPVLDGYSLPQGSNSVFAEGRQNDVPLMVGWTSAETKWVQMNLEQFRAARAEQFPGLEDQAAKFYPAANDDEALRAGITMTSDFWLVYRTWLWAESQRATGKSPVFRYLFDQVQAAKDAPVAPNDPGAAHAKDIPFVFDAMDYMGDPVSQADRATSDLIMKYWVQFARAGDPNAPGLPDWAPYDEDSGYTVMRFKAGARAEPDAGRKRLEFVDSVLRHE